MPPAASHDTQPPRVFIALGSNLGDREWNIRESLRRLEAGEEIRVVAVSSLMENPAVGGPADSPPFLNAVAEIDTALAPQALLTRMREVERILGRERRERWGPRTIDLDLLLYGSEIIHDPGLDVPHPRMQDRRFVLGPLAELTPDLMHPALGKTVAELMAQNRERDQP